MEYEHHRPKIIITLLQGEGAAFVSHIELARFYFY